MQSHPGAVGDKVHHHVPYAAMYITEMENVQP